jgi:hypothetical protein
MFILTPLMLVVIALLMFRPVRFVVGWAITLAMVFFVYVYVTMPEPPGNSRVSHTPLVIVR